MTVVSGSPAERLLGVALVGAALGLWVALLSVMERLKAEERRSRWASNLRDLVNAGCLLALVAAFHAAGLPLAVALFAGGTLGIALDLTRYSLRPRTGGRRAALGAIVFGGLAAALSPAHVLAATEALVRWTMGSR